MVWCVRKYTYFTYFSLYFIYLSCTLSLGPLISVYLSTSITIITCIFDLGGGDHFRAGKNVNRSLIQRVKPNLLPDNITSCVFLNGS